MGHPYTTLMLMVAVGVLATAASAQDTGSQRPLFQLRAEKTINLEKETARAAEDRAHDQIVAGLDQREDLENVNHKKQLEAADRAYHDPDYLDAQKKRLEREHANNLKQIGRAREIEDARHARRVAEIEAS